MHCKCKTICFLVQRAIDRARAGCYARPAWPLGGMVDSRDLKSLASDGMRVRVPQRLPKAKPVVFGHGFFFARSGRSTNEKGRL